MAAVMVATILFGQDASVAEYTKAVSKMKGVQSACGLAVKTNHRAAVKNDEVTNGDMYVEAPDKICLTFNNCADQLIMNSGLFTMTVAGKRYVTDSKKEPIFATFQAVLESIIGGGANTAFASMENVKMTKNGADVVITITPKQDAPAANNASEKGAKQKVSRVGKMFTSFVIVVNSANSGLKSIRMNGKGANYTLYEISNIKTGEAVDSKFFK